MATVQNIVINQNADYSKQFTAKDDTGTVIDLTGKTVSAKLRKSYGSSTATTFTPAKVAPHTAGTFTLALTYGDTALASLKRGRHVYDVVIETGVAPDEIKTRIQEGIATISPSVTRPA